MEKAVEILNTLSGENRFILLGLDGPNSHYTTKIKVREAEINGDSLLVLGTCDQVFEISPEKVECLDGSIRLYDKNVVYEFIFDYICD